MSVDQTRRQFAVGVAAFLTLICTVHAEPATPVFSDTGPDAAAYGAAAGFPVGTRGTASELGNLVGTYSHFDELFSSRVVRRATTPWRFKHAPEPRFRNALIVLTSRAQQGSVSWVS
jgi:hypothetical protein